MIEGMIGGVDMAKLELDGRERRHTPSMDPPRKQWEVRKLYDDHAEIIRLAVLGVGTSDIAKQLGKTPVSISMVLDSALVKDQIAMMQAERDVECVDVAREIKEFAPTCLSVLKDVVKGTGAGEAASINLRVATSKDILDRAGYGAVKKFQGQIAQGVFTKEDIDELKNRRQTG
jgi:hypothetical protein